MAVLNGSAAIAWLVLEGRPSTTEELAGEVGRIYGLAPHEVRESLHGILEHWRADGWLSRGSDGAWSISAGPSGQQETAGHAPADVITPDGDGRRLAWSRRLAMPGRAVLLSVWGGPRQASAIGIERLRGVLSGIPEAPASPSDRDVSVIFAENGVAVTSPQASLMFRDDTEASAALHALLILAAAEAPAAFTTLHAAAVSRQQGAVVMPAVSGSGKTTLTAHLITRGWRYGGDDIVGVGRTAGHAGLTLHPHPTALGVKEGSLGILGGDYPELRAMTPLSYGQKVTRFLPVARNLWTPASGDWRRIRAIVVPEYRPGAICERQDLPQEEALRAILDAGIGTTVKADRDCYGILFELVRTVPSYRLRYSRLADAEGHLASLMP